MKMHVTAALKMKNVGSNPWQVATIISRQFKKKKTVTEMMKMMTKKLAKTKIM